MAKYCMKCGGQCADQAMQCPRCGAMLGMQNSGNVSQRPSGGGSQFSGGYASPKQMQSINGMRPQESNGNIYSSESRNNKKWIRNISIVLGTLVVVVLLVLVVGKLINPSIRGTWTCVDKKGDVQTIVIDGQTCTFTCKGDDTDESTIYNMKVLKDKIYLEAVDEPYSEYLWYRRHGNKLYIYEEISDYEADKYATVYKKQ